LRKKLARTEHVLIVKDFRKKKNCERFHDTRARFLSKVTFESDFRKQTFYCVTTLRNKKESKSSQMQKDNKIRKM